MRDWLEMALSTIVRVFGPYCNFCSVPIATGDFNVISVKGSTVRLEMNCAECHQVGIVTTPIFLTQLANLEEGNFYFSPLQEVEIFEELKRLGFPVPAS